MTNKWLAIEYEQAWIRTIQYLIQILCETNYVLFQYYDILCFLVPSPIVQTTNFGAYVRAFGLEKTVFPIFVLHIANYNVLW
jgi:hypothetical protein